MPLSSPKSFLATLAALAIVATTGTEAMGSSSTPAVSNAKQTSVQSAPLQAAAVHTAPVRTAAPTSLTVTAPTKIPKGNRLYVQVEADSPDVFTTAYVEKSKDGNSWTRTTLKVPITDGKGASSWAPTGSLYYRVVADGVTSEPWRTTLEKKSGYAITAGTRNAVVHPNENAYVALSATKAGKGLKVRARLQWRTPSGNWTTVKTVKTSSAGNYTFLVRPTGDRYYRAVILDSAGKVLATSSEFFVDYASGTSTLEERRATMAWRLGASTTGIKKLSSSTVAAAKYTGGAKAARYQKFKKGVIVEVTSSSGKAQAWVVEGRQLKGYNDRSAWNGKLGLPERDVRCLLLEGGCVQLFSRGAIYTNTSKMSKGIYVAAGQTSQTEIIAAALSQKGYEEPSWRVSKYNKWIGGDNAWCQVFVAWATYASGHKGEAPVNNYFPTYLSNVKKSKALIRDPKGSQIKAGDVLVFDWGTGTPTHTGFAVKVSGSYVYTIEGNTTDGSGDPQRGVYYRKRPISGVWGSYSPLEYKKLS